MPTVRKQESEFSEDKWEKTINSLILKRIAKLTNRSIEQIERLKNEEKRPVIKISKNIERKASNYNRNILEDAILLLGLDGERISVEDIIMGYSNINVGKMNVFNSKYGSGKSSWLLKWGMPIRKLQEEASAHVTILKEGIDRRLYVPMLYQNVLPWHNVGFLCYAYEDDAKTALEILNDKGVKEIGKHLAYINRLFYLKKKVEPIIPIEEIRKWWKLDEGQELNEGNDLLGKPLEVTTSLIHGDFHLRNILIKDKPLIIDFAHSKKGPVSIDLAKIITDCVVFGKKIEISKNYYKESGLNDTILEDILKSFKKNLLTEDDQKFLKIAMYMYSFKYIGYKDVKNTIKTKLKAIIRDSNLFVNI